MFRSAATVGATAVSENAAIVAKVCKINVTSSAVVIIAVPRRFLSAASVIHDPHGIDRPRLVQFKIAGDLGHADPRLTGHGADRPEDAMQSRKLSTIRLRISQSAVGPSLNRRRGGHRLGEFLRARAPLRRISMSIIAPYLLGR